MNAKSQKKERMGWNELLCILLYTSSSPERQSKGEQRNTQKEFPMSLLKIMPKAKGKNGMMDGWMDGWMMCACIWGKDNVGFKVCQ